MAGQATTPNDQNKIKEQSYASQSTTTYHANDRFVFSNKHESWRSFWWHIILWQDICIHPIIQIIYYVNHEIKLFNINRIHREINNYGDQTI